jgi:multiple sugar transport system substrate-binding protein
VEEVFKAAFANVQGQYVTDNWSKVGSYIQPQLVSVYNGQTPMSEVLKNAQDQFGK